MVANDASFNDGTGIATGAILPNHLLTSASSNNTWVWDTWTPQIDQGASTNIAKTVTFARYIQIGKLIIAECRLDITGTGTGANKVTVTLPTTPNNVNFHSIGSGAYADAGTANYRCVVATNNSTNKIQFLPTNTAGSTDSVGVTPNLAVASGDELDFTVMYETA